MRVGVLDFGRRDFTYWWDGTLYSKSLVRVPSQKVGALRESL